MKNKEKRWIESPTVTAALSWLLPSTSKSTPRDTIRKARIIGLLDRSTTDRSHINGMLLSRLTKRSLYRLPKQSEKLGELLHGLGEMAAHSHANILDRLITYLHARHLRIRWTKVLISAFSHEQLVEKRARLDAIAFSQWLSSAKLEWDTLTNAYSYLRYGREPILCGYYGLTFVSHIILSIDAHAVDDLVFQYPNDPRVAAIGRAAFRVAIPFDTNARAEALLRSRSPAIQCLGVAALIAPPEQFFTSLTLRDCRETLMKAGVSVADASWMIGLRLKEDIHEYYRLQGSLKDQSARQRQIENDPANAYGGAQNAAAEVERIQEQIAVIDDRYRNVIERLETWLTNMAELWPEGGLSYEQMQWLEPCFVGKVEFRYRLAEKLRNASNRNTLLKRNISQVKETFGFVSDIQEAGKNRPNSLNDQEFEVTAEWCAKSLALLYKAGNHGSTGKKTGILLQAIHLAAVEVMNEPYIAVRKPTYWENVITSAAYAYRFALVVADVSQPISNNGCDVLRDFAIQHTYALLAYGQTPPRVSWLFFRLGLETLHSIKNLKNPDKIREKWALSEELPSPVRALSLWSSPSLVTLHHTLAADLFEQTGKPPLARDEHDLVLEQLLNLADTAIAAASGANRTDLVEEVVSRWDHTYAIWTPIAASWSNCAEKLAKAIAADGSERQWLLAEPAFQNSACTMLIRLSGSS